MFVVTFFLEKDGPGSLPVFLSPGAVFSFSKPVSAFVAYADSTP